MMYANDLAEKNGKLKVHFISSRSKIKKSDAFLIEYNGYLLLEDSGDVNIHIALDYLLGVRKRFLEAKPELEDDSGMKLRINWVASHFHKDHVSAFINDIIPCELIEINNVDIPPQSVYDIPEQGVRMGINEDRVLRLAMYDALEKHQRGKYTVHVSEFGRENVYSFMSESGASEEARLTIYPPVNDWGTSERVEKIADYYAEGDLFSRQIPVAVLNANSQWLEVSLGDNKFLFTGDTMKRTDSHDDEPLDEMVEAYREQIGRVSVLKYVHHGLRREDAAALMAGFDADNIVFTGMEVTCDEAMLQLLPEYAEELRDKFVYTERADVVYTCDAHHRHLSRELHPISAKVIVNDYAPITGKLNVDFCFVPDRRCSDAFIGTLDNEVFMIDGGNDNTLSLSKLMAIRERFCESGGLDPADVENKLRLDLVISHFHVDHVTALIKYVIPSPCIEIGDVYLPVASVLGEDDYYDSFKNGDITFRPALIRALQHYQGSAKLHYVDFGEQLTKRLCGGKLRIDLYGATEDWGAGDVNDRSRGIGYIRHEYYASKDEEYTRFFLSIATVNANCMWCKITYGERAFLFVGDTFKKLKREPCGEPMDHIVELYGGEEFKCDVLKFAHHGHHRRASIGILEKYMKPEYVVFTVDPATSAPDMNKIGVKWLNSAYEEFSIMTDGHDLIPSITPHSETHKVEDEETEC